jgi:HK97 gp10 family phage protein
MPDGLHDLERLIEIGEHAVLEAELAKLAQAEKSLKDLGELSVIMMVSLELQKRHLSKALEKVAKKVRDTARDEIGFYQPEVGPFPEWAELADSTEAEKARLGYEPNAPLLRTGEMRESIGYQVEGLEAAIGSTDPKMVFHEFGTVKMPPRPVLGPAVVHNKERIERAVGTAFVTAFISAQVAGKALGGAYSSSEPMQVHHSLGYNMTIGR